MIRSSNTKPPIQIISKSIILLAKVRVLSASKSIASLTVNI